MKQNIMSLLLSLAFFLFTGSASAVPPAEGVPFNPVAGQPVLREIIQTFLELNLSPQQQVQIKSIVGTHQDEILNTASLLFAARLNLFDVIHQETYDEEAVVKAAKDLSAAEEQLAVLRAKVAHEIRPVLTDQQKILLASKRTNLTERIKRIAEFVKARFVDWVSAPSA